MSFEKIPTRTVVIALGVSVLMFVLSLSFMPLVHQLALESQIRGDYLWWFLGNVLNFSLVAFFAISVPSIGLWCALLLERHVRS